MSLFIKSQGQGNIRNSTNCWTTFVKASFEYSQILNSCYRIGHRSPMLVGCAFNMVATLGFGYLRNFYLLILTRVMQAIGGSLSVVGGNYNQYLELN